MNTGSGILTVGPAASQPVCWDLNGATAGAGGATPAGIWDAANTYWNDAAGTGTAAAWTAGATAAFAAGSDATGTYSVTVDGTPDIGGLTFEEGTVTLSGGTALRLVSDSVAFVNTGLTATIATPISQDATSRGLTKSGTGTLVLSGTSSYTGPTAVGAGTLQLTNTSAIGSSTALTLGTGGTLALRGDASATFTTPGNGTTLFGEIANGATATVDVNNLSSGSGNTLKLGGGTGIYALAGTTTTLTVTGGNGYGLRTPVTLKRTTNVSPILTLNPTTASAIVDGLYLIDVAGGSLGLTLGGTNTGANEVTGTLTGSGLNGAWLTLTKNTAAKWKWSVAVTTTNALNTTAISAGDLIVTGTLMCQGGRNLTQSGGTLHYNSPTAVSANGTSAWIITGGNLDNTSGAAITSTGNPLMQWNGNFTFLGSNGAASDLNLGTGAVTMNAARTVTVSNASATLTVGGAVGDGTGVFGLTKTGPGTLKLAGASTFDGPTTVSDGTLAVTGSLGATAVSVNAGTLAGNGNFGGNVTIAAGARHALAVAATAAGQDTSVITGTLAMAGSILDLTAAATPAAGEYVLATATVAITGTPATINYNGISGTVSVDTASTPKKLLLTVTAAGFDSWKTANSATGQTLAQDHDGDGVPNGIEYFLVGPNGNSTGFTTLPGVSNTGGVLSVTWTKAADYTGVYPTDFVVETSETLTGTWVAEAVGGNVTITGNQVKYTFPSPLGSKKFARLKVTGP